MTKRRRLYSYFRSSASYRVRIALGLKGLAYEYTPIHLVKAEQLGDNYRRINPLCELPTLEFSDGNQRRRLAQSVAIIEYLDELHPNPPLFPGDPFNRALIRQRVEAVNAGIQPVQNLRVMKRVVELTGGGRPEMAAWGREWITLGFDGLEPLLESSAGEFSVGDTVSAADVFLIPQVYNAQRFGVNLDDYPCISRIAQRCSELPAFRAAHPHRQPDTPHELVES